MGEPDRAPRAGAALEARRLTFAYAGRAPALKNVDLVVPAGGYLALVGQNGAGKTTLAKHFNGLLRPIAGEVWVDGANAAERAIGDLSQLVGYVFQNPDQQIFSGTTRDEIAFGPRNLGLGDDEIRQRVDESLGLFGLSDVQAFPPAMLGYGNRRKVALAAVFAMRPRALILDEPTSGLDRRSVGELMAQLDAYVQAGRTVVVITHDVRLVADHVPRCAVLNAGELIAHGETRAVLRQEGLLRTAGLRLPPVGRLARSLDLDSHNLPLDVAAFRRAYAARRSGSGGDGR